MYNQSSIGLIIGMRYRLLVAFGEEFISKGYIDSSHTVSTKILTEYWSHPASNILGGSNNWRKLPFVKGNDISGYWFDKEGIDKYKASFKTIWTILLVIAIALIAFGAINATRGS